MSVQNSYQTHHRGHHRHYYRKRKDELRVIKGIIITFVGMIAALGMGIYVIAPVFTR